MVDPTALNEQKKLKSAGDQTKNLRAFIFSLLGALAGAAVCVFADFFIGNITGILYLFVGMAACAFYLYFIDKPNQRNYHFAFIAVACVIATIAAVFVDVMILYASQVQEPDMNVLQKALELYKVNIAGNGFNSYKHIFTDNSAVLLDLSLLSFHTVCAFMSLVGLSLSWLFIKISSKGYEKKHGSDNSNYSYSSRKKKMKKKR